MITVRTARHRRLLFFLLYCCEGAPIGFLWWLVPVHARTAGVPVHEIALFTSILVLPWAFKFLWAPLVDLRCTDGSRLLRWLYVSQVLMAVVLIPLFFIDWQHFRGIVALFLMLHTTAAATQDVVIDTLCIRSVGGTEIGSVNGWMQAGMLTGRSLFGGLALMVSAVIPVHSVLLVLILLLAGSSMLVLYLNPAMVTPSNRTYTDLPSGISMLFRSGTMRRLLLFAATGGIAYEGAALIAGPFFVDRGIPQEQIGLYFSTVSVILMAAGSLAGGTAADILPKRKLVVRSLLFISACVAGIGFVAAMPVTQGKFLPLLAFSGLYFFIGMFTAVSYAYFMSRTDSGAAAVQFSALMGATNLCEAAAGLLSGAALGVYGYSVTLYILAAVSVASLPLIPKNAGSGTNAVPQ